MPHNDYNYGKDYIMKQDKEKVTRPDAPLTREKKDFELVEQDSLNNLFKLFLLEKVLKSVQKL